MDKLLTYPGGQPFGLDDVLFMDSTFRNVINSIFAGLIKQNCIITGCETLISDGQLNVSEGYVLIGNEIFYLPAQNLTYDETKYYVIRPNIYEDANSLRTFKDGTTHYVWQRREAQVLEVDIIQTGDIDILDYKQKASFILGIEPGPWVEPQLYDNWEAVDMTAGDGYPPFRYRLLNPNTIQYYGALRYHDGVYNIMDLPQELRFGKSTIVLAWNESRGEIALLYHYDTNYAGHSLRLGTGANDTNNIIVNQIIKF